MALCAPIPHWNNMGNFYLRQFRLLPKKETTSYFSASALMIFDFHNHVTIIFFSASIIS